MLHPHRHCLFNLRQLAELAQAHTSPMHAAFVDFSKAFSWSCGQCWSHAASTQADKPHQGPLHGNQVQVAGHREKSERLSTRTGVRLPPLPPPIQHRHGLLGPQGQRRAMAFRMCGQVVSSLIYLMLLLTNSSDIKPGGAGAGGQQVGQVGHRGHGVFSLPQPPQSRLDPTAWQSGLSSSMCSLSSLPALPLLDHRCHHLACGGRHPLLLPLLPLCCCCRSREAPEG